MIIKNGQIIDGIGKPGYKGDIAIKNDKIASIGKIVARDSKDIIDASGLLIVPGFVDIHSHSDYYLIIDPRAESKIMQGVTTEAGGNCGYSAAPVGGKLHKEREKSYREQFGIELSWTKLRGYYESLKIKGTAVNFAPLLGYNTIRGSVMGYEDRDPCPEEIKKMKQLILKGIKQGAFGMSVGLVYPPACYSKIEELEQVYSVVEELDGLFTCHMRSESRKLIEAITETLLICSRTGVRTQISHLKTAGKENWNKIKESFSIIENALDNNFDVACDRYPYTASQTGLSALLPDWVFEGGIEKQMKRLQTKSSRKSIKTEILKNHKEPEYWETVMVSQVVNEKNKDLEGKRVSEGAEMRKKDPFDFIFDLLLEERSQVEAIYFCMSEENLREIIKKDYVMIGSDSGARGIDGPLGIGNPHPRGYGTYPRVLGKYVRKDNVLGLEEAIKKMTYDPCQRLGINDRGLIKKNYFADIVIFDPDKIEDKSTYEDPKQYPVGIEYVFVNGKLAVKNGKPTGILAGKGLKKG